jgi:chromate transporter
MAIAAFLRQILEYQAVQRAFFGVRVVVCALIVHAVVKLWKSAVKDFFGIAVYLAALALSLFTGVPTVLLILLSLLAGIIRARFGKPAEVK